MQVTKIKSSDQDQIYERFLSAQVRRQDICQNVPNSGFFEYDLTYDQLKERTQDSLSIALKNSQGKIIAYTFGYTIKQIRTALSHHDEVHKRLKGELDDSVYLDQLFLEKGYPLHLAMQLFDSWDFLTQMENVPKVFTAIPNEPWRNVSSEKLAIYRGFKRNGFVRDEKLSLSIFEKPFYKIQ